MNSAPADSSQRAGEAPAPFPQPADFSLKCLNPWTLAFTGAWENLEEEFQSDYARQSLKYIRAAFGVGIFFYSIFGFLDLALIPNGKAAVWTIRFGVVVPVLVGCILLSFLDAFRRFSQLVISFVIVVAGGGISVMVALIPPPATHSYYAGVMLVLMLGYGFVRARFVYASLGGWINVLIYEIVAIGVVDTPVAILVNNNFFFISANIIGMFSSYALEYYTRKDFFMARMLAAERRKVTQLNQGLESKVRTRTAELQEAYDDLRQEARDRESLQSQLLHAQKMESVGRLAGGVAHDFNNMLGVIIGFSELAQVKVAPDHPIVEDLEGIQEAAERSHDITRQLLAFARRETIAPVVVDLNVCIDSVIKVIKRLIGEDIDLSWRPSDEVLPVLMDRSQLEQVLANLCINARDAIEDVGRISIRTRACVLDGATDGGRRVPPGDYAVLSVADTGKGMDRETLGNIFEPFFTTKEMGRGTGLGLATVHGIVEQNEGLVRVESAPGAGTTFDIFLPRHERVVVESTEASPHAPVKGNGERVLVVEDEGGILRFVRQFLTQYGYRVHAAQRPSEALQAVGGGLGDIDLLITDVVMPEMNGKDLARHIRARYPRIRCIYMSGYTADVIARHGVLDSGLNFLQKPFSSRDMAAKVRAVLDAPE